MSELEIVRDIPAEEAKPYLTQLVTTLLGDPHSSDFDKHVEAWRRSWPVGRVWGVRDRDRWVATLATEPHRLTVPGLGTATTEIEADGVSAVSVAATHRRRGLLTRMITESLHDAKDRGDPVSILIAAEWPIYGRYGYAPATQSAQYTYRPRSPLARLAPSGTGTVRQVEPAELATVAESIFEKFRRLRPGQVDREREWWPRRLATDGYQPVPNRLATWILHESADGPDGLLGWKRERDFELDGRLGSIEVVQFAAASEDAYRDLFAYLSGIDAIDEILLHERPVDEPLRWMLADGRALRQTYTGDDLWLRLLDVPAALAARRYAVPGRLVLDVTDADLGGYGAARVVLEADADEVSCAPTDTSPELRVTQRVLASTYLGGFSFSQLASGGGVAELRPGALARADAMFRTPLAPWNATGF